MFRILVTLNVKDFDALHQFETQASRIMHDHHGEIELAYEVKPQKSVQQEIHLVRFNTEADFKLYAKDERLKLLADLRDRAIESTELTFLGEGKQYRSLGV